MHEDNNIQSLSEAALFQTCGGDDYDEALWAMTIGFAFVAGASGAAIFLAPALLAGAVLMFE